MLVCKFNRSCVWNFIYKNETWLLKDNNSGYICAEIYFRIDKLEIYRI